MKGRWLWPIVLVCTPAIGEIALSVDDVQRPVASGEPVYLRVVVRNDGDAVATVWPVWQWCAVVEEQFGASPTVLQRRVQDNWATVEPASLQRALDWHYRDKLAGHWYRRPILLRPGAYFVLWWDVGWHYELGPGSYRFRLALPLGVEPAAPPVGETDWVAFRVTSGSERDQAVRSDAQLREHRRTHRRDRYGWLKYCPEEDLQATAFAAWRCYFEVERYLSHPAFARTAVLDAAIRNPRLWTERESTRLLPLWDRIELALRVESVLAHRYESLAERERETVALLHELTQSDDPELAQLLGRRVLHSLAAVRMMQSRDLVVTGDDIMVELNWPWYALPADQWPAI